jgi:ubiquinone biosynthesis protein
VRYWPRYRRIAVVLGRHGLGWLTDHAGLSRLITWSLRLFRRDRDPQEFLSMPQRLRHSLQELGPAFVLFGHYLSARSDLLPAELCQELAKLPMGAPPIDIDEVLSVVEEELGQPWQELFSEFDARPWQCTWLEQTHVARLPDGKHVLVSIPNLSVRAQVEQDRPVLREIARLVEERRIGGTWWRASEPVQAFEQVVRQQLDARGQGRNIERWHQQFASRDGICFPTVDWERTTARILTYCPARERLLEELVTNLPGEDPDLARDLYRFFTEAIFVDGFYPVAPYLGRPARLEGGLLTLTTFAPVGYLDRTFRKGIARLLRFFQEEKLDRLIALGVSIGFLERHHVSATEHQALRHLLDRYHDLPLTELRLDELAGDLFALGHRGVIALPEEIALVLRTWVAVEQLGRRLAPRLAPAEVMAPILQRMVAEQRSWKVREERLRRAGRAWLEAIGTFPKAARSLLVQAREGDLLIAVEPRGLDKPMRRLKRMVHRIVLSVIAAGLLVALTLLATALFPEAWQPWRWIPAGLALLTLSGLGFSLLLTFLRRE